MKYHNLHHTSVRIAKICLLFLSLIALSSCDRFPFLPDSDVVVSKPSATGAGGGSPPVIEYWVAGESEKVLKGEIPSWLETTNREVWNGTRIHVFGGRNEVVGFQLILRADQFVESADVEISSLVNGGYEIKNDPGATDATRSKGRRIELFVQHYLEILRASKSPWNAGSLYFSANAQPQGFVGKFVPDALIPFEVMQAKHGYSFQLKENEIQGIWADIYIPKNTPPGIYQGTVKVKANGNVLHTIPIELKVYCFTLPDKPTTKTMLYIDMPEIYWRHGVQPNTPQAKPIREAYYQLIHRHKLSFIESGRTIAEAQEALPTLTGSLYTSANNYEGPGENTGEGVYSIGTYGYWWFASWTNADRQQKADDWVTWFQQNSPTTDYFLYVVDELNDGGYHQQVQNLMTGLRDHTGVGSQLPRMLSAKVAGALMPGLNKWFLYIPDYSEDYVKRACKANQQVNVYNGYLPHSGTFILDDHGVSPRVNPWIQFMHGIPRWFYWMGNYWSDWHGKRSRLDPFVVAENFRNGYGEIGMGDGTLLYPGEQPWFVSPNDYEFKGGFASIRLKNWRRGVQDTDYLGMVNTIDNEYVNQLLTTQLPTSLHTADRSKPATWGIRGNAWDAARKQLANKIELHCQENSGQAPSITKKRENTDHCVKSIKTKKGGNWSDASIWIGGVIPGDGDTVHIEHHLEIDQDTTLGSSPDDNTTEDIVIFGSSGSLVIKEGVTLTVKGNLFLSAANLVVKPGAKIVFDVPAGKKYQLKVGYAHNQSSFLYLQGTKENRAVLEAKAGGGIVQILGGQRWTGDQKGGWKLGGNILADYAIFRRVGDAQNPAHYRYVGGNASYIVKNSIIDTCGVWTASAHDAEETTIQFVNNTFRNSQGEHSIELAHWIYVPTKPRDIIGNVFDKPVLFHSGEYYRIEDNYFAEGFKFVGRSPKTFLRNLVRKTSSGGLRIVAKSLNIENNYWLSEHNGVYNQNISLYGEGSISQKTYVRGNIFEFTGSDTQGFAISFGDFPKTQGEVVIEKNIILPNGAGKSTGALFLLQGSQHLTLHVRRNTFMIGETTSYLGLVYGGHVGMLASYRNNLAWDTQVNRDNFLLYGLPSSIEDIALSSSIDYNNKFNADDGSNGNGYSRLAFSSGSPGANDKTVNPNFFDPTRNVARWVDSLVSMSGTDAEKRAFALQEISKMNDDDFDSRFTITNLVAFVRAGFRPTNNALKGAGSPLDGSPDIGAVDMTD